MANSDMLVRVIADTKNYDANLAKASKTLKQFADNNLSMGGVLKQSTSALTGMAAQVLSVAAVIGAAKKVVGDMVQINKQFEQSSSNLAAVLGTSRDQITALTDQAKQLGATTQYTASQILELQANLARLGFNQTEILNSTKSVQAMATAMGADLGEAANLAGSALRGFGLQATEMERVASVLSVGTTKSALSFEKLATALPIVQTAAAKTGFTIEDTVAMLGKLTDNGINAASAATQLRKILNDSTTAGTKLANALGGPVKSFDELVVALDKANKAGQNHADSVALVNSKNATALDILRDMAQQREVEVNGVKKQTSALQELRESITDCSDGMRAMQDEQLNTLQGSITILNSAWEGLMLTFSESNGVIKTVVDNLSGLLQTWTKWRNRNAGGDAAIKTYEMAEPEVAKYGKQYIEGDRASGMSDSEIKRKTEEENEKFKEQKKILEDLLREYDEYEEYRKSRSWTPEELHDRMVSTNDNLKKHGYSLAYGQYEKLQKDIAKKNDAIAINDYIVSALSPASTGSQTGGEGSDNAGDGAKTKSRLAVLKAQYGAQEKAQIASLDRMAMNEADYEASVYKIKRETLQKIADLYQEETAEKASANAAISQLDIAYQGTQMRLATKGTSKAKTCETLTGPSGYSQEGISALRSEIQDAQKSMQMGSKKYMVEANRLVDLTTFENLLQASVERGVQINPTLLEGLFENIDLGIDVKPEAWQALVDDINKKLAELDLPPIELDVKTGAVTKTGQEVGSLTDKVNGAISAFGQLGGAIQQIDDPSAKVAGIVMGAVAEVAGTFAASLKGTFTPWDWIAAALSGTATMISTITAIKSATSGNYASGGKIPGNSFSGDNMRGILPNGDLIGLDAGEVILNRAQQGSIAGQLQNNPLGNLHLTSKVRGSDLLVVLDNTNSSRGGQRGMYVNVK